MLTLLKEHEEEARFSKALATIRLDAPIAFTLPERSWRESIDAQKVYTLFDELGFRSLRERARSVLAKSSGLTSQEQGYESTNASGLPEPVPEEVDQTQLAEAAVMLWLISSEFTNPSLDDILAFTKERSFAGAYAALEKQLAELGRVREVYEHIEKPLIPVLRSVEARGVLIDRWVLDTLGEKYRADLKLIEERIHTTAGCVFNVSSPKQLGEVLFDELKLIPERQKKTAGGARSTRESELEKIRDVHPIVGDIIEYRELKKLLSTYIENLPPMLDDENRLHAEFLQSGTTTGRIA